MTSMGLILWAFWIGFAAGGAALATVVCARSKTPPMEPAKDQQDWQVPPAEERCPALLRPNGRGNWVIRCASKAGHQGPHMGRFDDHKYGELFHWDDASTAVEAVLDRIEAVGARARDRARKA